MRPPDLTELVAVILIGALVVLNGAMWGPFLTTQHEPK